MGEIASSPEAARLATIDRKDVEALPDGSVRVIVNRSKVNDVRYLNKFFEAVNGKLPLGGRYLGLVETSEQRKRRLLDRHPGWFGRVYYAGDFVFKRVFPKLRVVRRVYFAITHGRNRVLSKAEALGRLCSCGFAIERIEEAGGRLYFLVRKVREPFYDPDPSYGPIFRMRRLGQGGRPIHVYKLRTMHPYAEYLQEHVYTNGRLDSNGKFRDDFRVTNWGRHFRRVWIDELPMLLNWVLRDLKLVGVRPLSEHYSSLYPPELAERRSRHRPGLIPPYYADLPGDFEEILRSEEAYLDSYEIHPIRTDLRYFFRAFRNIVFRGARSK